MSNEIENAKQYINRLREINKDADKRTVYECIDRPIRKLIYHMNRIGIKTRFSCCGFPYDGEEEPKTHDKATYVQFYAPDKDKYDMFMKFVQDAQSSGFEISHFAGPIWIARCKNPIPDEYSKSDGIREAIHDYENQVRYIKIFEETLSRYPTSNRVFKIEDGNKQCKQFMEEWQVQPKKDAEFTVIDDLPKRVAGNG